MGRQGYGDKGGGKRGIGAGSGGMGGGGKGGGKRGVREGGKFLQISQRSETCTNLLARDYFACFVIYIR